MKIMLPLLCLLIASCNAGPDGGDNPVEVGAVNWLRDHDAALAQSKESGKPVFLLFQEVPGCAGCKQFGKDVLSDPAVVKSIEENFVPLLIPNNKEGKDREILNRYNEPAWNYQVVRFLDSQGKDLIPRKDKVWTTAELNQRIDAALEKSGKPKAAAAPKTGRLAISQSCFWTGSKKLTSAYRPAPAGDQKRQIRGTAFQKLVLTPEQATKVNSYARTNPSKALTYLTKSQKKQLSQ